MDGRDDIARPSACVVTGLVLPMLAYLAIFASALAGFAGAPIWTVAIGAVALATLSYAEHFLLYQRGAEQGLTELVDSTLLASLWNGALATSIAYVLGVAVRLLSV